MDANLQRKINFQGANAKIILLSGLALSAFLFFVLLTNAFPATTSTQASQPGQYCAELGGQCMASQGCAGQGGYNIGKIDCPGATICCRQFPEETPTPTPLPTVTLIPTIPLPSLTPLPSPTTIPSPTAVPNKRVFVTSQSYTGNLGGIAGVDALCQSVANAANLGGSWKAWLSVGLAGQTDPDSRMFHSPSSYTLVNGTFVAASWADLTDQNLSHAININELGQTVLPVPNNWNVWTNTWTNGTVYDTATNLTCDNFTSASSSLTGRGGSSGATDYTWTAQSYPGGHACNVPHRIYCIEQ